MPFKPSPNQFGQIVTCVAALRALATRMGGLVEFRTFDSFYKDEVVRVRLIDAINTLFDAQRIGDGSLAYLGNVFGPDHMGRGVILDTGTDGDVSYSEPRSYSASERVQHMSVRHGVRRVQAEMARFGTRMRSKAFKDLNVRVGGVGSSSLYVAIGLDSEVTVGFNVSVDESEVSPENIAYMNDAMGKLATAIKDIWPNVISGFGSVVEVLDENSGIAELRKVNPLWGTW